MSSPPDPTRPSSPPVWPLLAAIGLVVLVATGWLAMKELERKQRNIAVAEAITGGDPTRAAAWVARYGCGGCHTIPGLPGADGKVAPPLADLRARVYIAGVLPNTAPNLIEWIVDPRAFSPRTAMPATGISKDQARDVAAYLYAQ
jgi:mono/diheme cytochrome c family protein